MKSVEEIVEEHEGRIANYEYERQKMQNKLTFLSEHKFNKECEYVRTQQDATSEMFIDYRNAIEQLRDVINSIQTKAELLNG